MFLKSFNYSIEMQKMKRKYNNSLMHYGLIGEGRVFYQLNKINDYVVCLYNIRFFVGSEKAQFDFIVITKRKIFIIEVKNLLGNLLITEDNKYERTIYKDWGVQKVGMDNPLIQMNYQRKLLQTLLRGYDVEIECLLVMANDKMIIENQSVHKNIIKYDEVESYLSERVLAQKFSNTEINIGNYILEKDKQYNYFMVDVIKHNIRNQYTPKFDNYIDLEIYIEILEFRKNYANIKNVPICNVFNNKEAEQLVISKPKTKEEFINVRGFKEKRYLMYGEEIIKIFKKYK